MENQPSWLIFSTPKSWQKIGKKTNLCSFDLNLLQDARPESSRGLFTKLWCLLWHNADGHFDFFLQNLSGEWFQWTFLLRDQKKRNHFESSTLWFLGILAFFSSSFSRETYHPWRPPNRSPSQGSHADTESDRSTAFQITVDHSKDPDPSGYHAWLWNLWSSDGGTSLISQAKHAAELWNLIISIPSLKFSPRAYIQNLGP